MARAIKQGQHIFIAFQDGEAVLDSQLRPRMYKSREQFEKSFPAWRDGKAELVEYAPTLTPPNEPPPCYQPDGDGCAYQCYDGDDEPIDKCKESPLCYSDKQRHHTPPNEPLTLGLVDKYGAPLYAGDTVTADKFFMYAIRYGSHNVNPKQCEPAYQVGWYLEIVWALYNEDKTYIGHTEALYDIGGVAARYPAHCADTTEGVQNLLFYKHRPPEVSP